MGYWGENLWLTRQVRPGTARIPKAAFEQVRSLGGLYSMGGTAPARSRAARAMEEAFEEEPLPELTGEAGEWQRHLHTVRQRGRAAHVVPAWRARWRTAKREMANAVELDAVAEEIADTHPGGAEAPASEARPEARAVAGRARRHKGRHARWGGTDRPGAGSLAGEFICPVLPAGSTNGISGIPGAVQVCEFA